jgi:hypothetical protein
MRSFQMAKRWGVVLYLISNFICIPIPLPLFASPFLDKEAPKWLENISFALAWYNILNCDLGE